MKTNLINLYVVQHKKSDSKTQIECVLDDDKNPKIFSVKMLHGNVIPLRAVKDVLDHFKEENSNHQE